MDSTGNTVGDSNVQFWQGVFRVDGSLGKITDGSGLDHVLDRVSLDGLVLRVSRDPNVSMFHDSLPEHFFCTMIPYPQFLKDQRTRPETHLGHTSGTVGASNALDVSSSLLVSSVSSSLFGHDGCSMKRR